MNDKLDLILDAMRYLLVAEIGRIQDEQVKYNDGQLPDYLQDRQREMYKIITRINVELDTGKYKRRIEKR